MSPTRDENKKYLKPPPSHCITTNLKKKLRQCPQILGSQAPHRRCVPPGRRSGSRLSLGLARPPEGGNCQGTRFFQGGLELFPPKNGGKKWGGNEKNQTIDLNVAGIIF